MARITIHEFKTHDNVPLTGFLDVIYKAKIASCTIAGAPVRIPVEKINLTTQTACIGQKWYEFDFSAPVKEIFDKANTESTELIEAKFGNSASLLITNKLDWATRELRYNHPIYVRGYSQGRLVIDRVKAIHGEILIGEKTAYRV